MSKSRQVVSEVLPGFIVCLGISLCAQVIGHFFPQIGAALFAILLGILAGNTFFNQPRLNQGVRFTESRLLEYSIALTGLTLNLSDVLSVGLSGFAFIILQMSGTILLAYLLGRRLGFGRKFSLLMSAGNAVCGSSAIGTVSPIIEADDKDKGISITLVNLTGTILMVVLPLLTAVLYNHETLQTSALIGGVLQSIGQVIAAGKLVNDDVTQFATIFKIVRIVMLVVVALVFARLNTGDEGSLFDSHTSTGEKTKVGIPWFIKVFFVFCVVVTVIKLPELVGVAAKKVSTQFEVAALAGIGMRVKFSDLVKEGPRGMVLGMLIGSGQVILAILLIKLLLN